MTELGLLEHLRQTAKVIGFAVLGLMVSGIGCDLGGRDRGIGNVDNGLPDSGTDPDAAVDAGTDATWRFGDAGSTWDDGGVEIDGPCANDCLYLYHMLMNEWDEVRGASYFEFIPNGDGTVRVRCADSALFIVYHSWEQGIYHRYRQRLIGDYILDESTHDLVSAQVLVYNRWGGIRTLKNYVFAYDQDADEFTFTVDFAGRRWTRILSTAEAPLVMFNHREYPIRTRGSHSSLLAFLLGERFDWTAGGRQDLLVFSPELERFDRLAVEKDTEQRLLVHFPADTAMPPWESHYIDGDVYETNIVPFEYKHGIPVWMGSRDHFHWSVTSGPLFELNLSLLEESFPQALPQVPTGFNTSSIAIPTADATLAGVIDDPDSAGPHPVVLMLPGWSHLTRRGEVGAVDLYAQLAARLAAAGYLVLRTDARGNGESGGDLVSASVDQLAADVSAMVGSLSAVAEADTAKLVLLTHRQGVHIAAAAIQESGVDATGLIALSPAGGDVKQDIRMLENEILVNAGFSENYATLRRIEVAEIIDELAAGTYPGDLWRGHDVSSWQSLIGRDLRASPAGLPQTLILIGSEDHLVPLSFATELRDGLVNGSVQAELQQLTGLSHAFTPGTADGLWPEHGGAEAVSDSAIDALVGWLAQF